MKIAFASKDGIFVNEHFGWSETFYLYEVTPEGYNFVKTLDSSKKYEDEIDKLSYKIECLEDSQLLYVQQIGPKASQLVKAHQIFPMQSQKNGDEKIEEVLNSLIKLYDNPPLWMKRLIAS